MTDQFNGVPFGDCQSGRMCPSKFMSEEFQRVYLGDDSKMNDTIKAIIDCIVGILEWINDTVNSEQFNHVNIERAVQQHIWEMKDKGHTGTDLREFQILLAVQICCLAKAVTKGHENLHNLIYPVAHLGVASQLDHVTPHERPDVLKYIINETGVSQYKLNTGEGYLCEMAVNQFGKIFDYVFLGQSLFCNGTEKGENLVKNFGSDTWERF